MGKSWLEPDFSRFFSTFPDLPQKLIRRDGQSQHSPNFGTGRVALPDPDPDLSKSRDGHPDLNLNPSRPNFCRDFIPLKISRPYLLPTDIKLYL